MKRQLLLPIRLILFILLSVILMLADSKTDILNQVRSVGSVISLPIHFVASSSVLLSRWVSGDLRSYDKLRVKHDELQRQNLILRSQLQKFYSLQSENDRLREILSSAARIAEEAMFGKIVEVGPDPYDRIVLVNRGTADGVFLGQPVLSPDGVVGQVTLTGLFRSSVTLITDPSQGIPVQLVRNGLRTILYGSGARSIPGTNIRCC